MAASPLAALLVLWMPCLIAFVLRSMLSRAAAQRAALAFNATSWVVAAFCLVLGLCCVFSSSNASSLWAQVGVLGLVGLAILGSFLWIAFQLAYRVLVTSRRTAFADLPVVEV